MNRARHHLSVVGSLGCDESRWRLLKARYPAQRPTAPGTAMRILINQYEASGNAGVSGACRLTDRAWAAAPSLVRHKWNSTLTAGRRQLQARVRRRAWHRRSRAPRVARKPRPPVGWELAYGQPLHWRRCAARPLRGAAVGCGARRTRGWSASIRARRPAYSPYQRINRRNVCGAAVRRLTDRA